MQKTILSMLILFIYSCGGGGGGSAPDAINPGTVLNNSNLDGEWSYVSSGFECTNDGSISVESYIGYAGSGPYVALFGFFVYPVNNCVGTPSLLHGVGYQYEISGASISYNYINEYFYIMDAGFVAGANGTSLCGFNDWVFETLKSIEGTACSIAPLATFSWSNIVLSSSTMQFKNSSNQNITLYKNNFNLLAGVESARPASDQNIVLIENEIREIVENIMYKKI